MSIRQICTASMVVCFLVACTPRSPSAAAASQTTTSEGWTVTFHLSGGFAGLDRRLDVSSSGAATATDVRREQRVTAQVPRDELTALERLVAAAKSNETARSDSCRDCFEYDVEITSSGRRVVVRLNDTSLSSSPSAPLIAALRRLQDRLLTGRGADGGLSGLRSLAE